MPILPQVVIQTMQVSLAGAGFLGVSAPQLAQAIGIGFSSYIITSPIIETTNTGTAGAGTGIGVGLILPPPVLIQNLSTSFDSKGIGGLQKFQLIGAISVTVSTALAAASIQTVSAGVGTGAGVVSSVIPVPPSSQGLMVGSFAAMGLLGVLSPSLAIAIAEGIDNSLPSAKGVVAVSGPPSIVPAVGKGIGKLL
jgi:hypothetical protein